MIEVAIYIVTLLNLVSAAILLPRYMRRSKIYQFTFVSVWTLHYVIGNALVLLSRDRTYALAQFSDFEGGYLMALIAGQYFLWVYLFLQNVAQKEFSGDAVFRTSAISPVLIIAGITSLFGALFISQIGPALFFSGELAQYRTGIGEIAGEGIGIFYYLATLMIPAALLAGAFAIDHPVGRHIALALALAILAAIVFVPLGGRGRVLNIVFVLMITFVLARREENLFRIINGRLLALVAALIAVAYIWGAVRDLNEVSAIPVDTADVINALAVDTTRLPNQAFIFSEFPSLGTYFGLHYLESILGPLYEYVSSGSVGLIQEYSARWYGTTVNNFDQRSAVSPSFLGEIYLNFGIVGIVVAPFAFFSLVALMRKAAGGEHPVTAAMILFFIQFNSFHGGLYALFDLLVVIAPLLLAANRLTVPARTQSRGHLAVGRVPCVA
jgi:hypothetical protein